MRTTVDFSLILAVFASRLCLASLPPPRLSLPSWDVQESFRDHHHVLFRSFELIMATSIHSSVI